MPVLSEHRLRIGNRDVTLVEGPAGWGECSPLPGYPSDLATCDACFLDDPTSRTMSVTLKTSKDAITIAPLTVTVDSSPNVKRFVMHLHH